MCGGGGGQIGVCKVVGGRLHCRKMKINGGWGEVGAEFIIQVFKQIETYRQHSFLGKY